MGACVAIVALAAFVLVGFSRGDAAVVKEFGGGLRGTGLISALDLDAGGWLHRVPGTDEVIDIRNGPNAKIDPGDAFGLLSQARLLELGTPAMRPVDGPLGYFQAWDFTKDSEVSNDNDTDSGQSPVEFPDWVFTVTGTTAPTVAAHGKGGLLTVTQATSDNDGLEVTGSSEWLKFEAGKSYRMVWIGKVNSITAGQVDWGFGLGLEDTAWLGDSDENTDGVFFEVNDGDTDIDLIVAYNDTDRANYSRTSALGTMPDDTTFTIVCDVIMDANTAQQGRIIVWIDGQLVHNSLHTGIVHDEELTLIWGIQNGAGSEANVITVDFVGAGGDR